MSNLIFNKIKLKIEKHLGLYVFVKERAKFEGWFKVELCDSLLDYFKDVVPEKNRVDISFEDWGIELKTVNTNVRYPNVKNKRRPITKNIQGVLDDIEKLKKLDFRKKGVLFIVFPITEDNKNWQTQFKKIESKLSDFKSLQFSFNGDISGVIYFGLI